MAVLADYVITPDVLDVNSYNSRGECGARIATIRDEILAGGLVRDLRDGEWSNLILSGDDRWHDLGRKLVKALRINNRLVRHPPALKDPPGHDPARWCSEALASNKHTPLLGGVITRTLTRDCGGSTVAPIDQLAGAQWWQHGESTALVRRTIDDYISHLDLIFRHATHIEFIDPHLDPSRRDYREFRQLIHAIGKSRRRPLIEIHRVNYEGPPSSRWFPLKEDRMHYKKIFERCLGETLRTAGLTATVYIWNDFHDRYLISNLVGVVLSNGYNTTTKPNVTTTWARLGRSHRDNIEAEFNPKTTASHELIQEFSIPGSHVGDIGERRGIVAANR